MRFTPAINALLNGWFFLQRVRRMGLTDEAVRMASAGKPHKIAGRCSVFAKAIVLMH